MERINIIILSLGKHDLAGNKRLKNLSRYVKLNHFAECKIITPLWDIVNVNKLNGLSFHFIKLFFFLGNLFLVPLVIIKNRKKNTRNFIYFYEMEHIFLHRLILAKLMGFRIIVDIVENPHLLSHSASIFRKIRFIYAGFIYRRFFLFFISGIIVVSKFLKETVMHDFDQKIPVLLLPVSFDPADYIQTPDSYENPTLFYGGSYGENFDFETFFKALAGVMVQHPDLKLYMTGKNKSEISKPIKEYLPYYDRVIFLGYLSEKQYFKTIRSMDILCLPRNNSIEANSGFPFKLAEYLATGKPVILSNISDVKDYLTNDDAFIYEPGNRSQLEAFLLKVLANPMEAMHVGFNGKKKADRFFSSVDQALIFTQFIRSL